jgi:hypothetical protein
MNSAVFQPMRSVILKLPVLAGEEVEHQAIVEAAVDVMTLPLPADEAEAEAFYGPERRVMVHGPGIDRMKAEIAERTGQESRTGEGRISPVAEGFLPGRPPKCRGSESAIDTVQAGDSDGSVVAIRRIRSQKMRSPLRHDLKQSGRDDLSSVAEIQPLVVLLSGQPARDQLEELGPVQREQLHVRFTAINDFVIPQILSLLISASGKYSAISPAVGR